MIDVASNEIVSALLLVLGIGIGFNLRFLRPQGLRTRNDAKKKQ